MVWGINYLQEPPQKFWPAHSFLKDQLVYTKLPATGNNFSVHIRLPDRTLLNYWMVQTKDKKGNETDIWDSGGDNYPYFSVNYQDGIFYLSGIFIFLAGFLPLLLHYIKNRGRQMPGSATAPIQIKDYIPQFDSIRAIAVLLVIIHHWIPEKSILNFLPNGPIGVNTFFVLSGFLITGILIKGKKEAEELRIKKVNVFRNFYIRRSLRIFPIYYLLLLVLFLLDDPAIKENGAWYYTYSSNFLFYLQQDFPARVAHLWSLAVEEQFYLVWPFLVIFTPKKLLPYCITAFFIIGVSMNFVFKSASWWMDILTPSCFDAFAIGALLSWLINYRSDLIARLQPAFRSIVLVAFLFFAGELAGMSIFPSRTIHSVLAVMAIYYSLFRKNNIVVNFILNNKWLIRIGKISYGIYLYHLFVPELWEYIINQLNAGGIDLFFNHEMPEWLKPAWLFIQEFFFLLLIASVSWKFIEKPINNLKDSFTIRAKPKTI